MILLVTLNKKVKCYYKFDFKKKKKEKKKEEKKTGRRRR